MQGNQMPVNPYHRGQIYRQQESVFEKQGLVRYDILRVFKKQDPFLTNCYSATLKEGLESLGKIKFITFERKTNSKTSYRHVVAVVGPENDKEKARLNGKKLQRRLKKMHHDTEHNLTDKQIEILSDVTCHPYRHGAALAWQKEFNRHSLVPNHEAIYARTAVRYFDLAQRQGWLARATEEAFLRFKKTLKFQCEPHRCDIKAAVQMYCESINLPLEDDHPPIGHGPGGGGGMPGGTPGGPATTAGGPPGTTAGGTAGTPMGETGGVTPGGPMHTASGYIGEVEAEDWGPMDHLRSAVWEDDIGAIAVGRPDGTAWQYSFEKLMELRTHFVEHPANFMETLLRVQPVFKPGAGFEFLELNQNDFERSRADGPGPSGTGTGDGFQNANEYEVIIREVPVKPEGATTTTPAGNETIAVLEPTAGQDSTEEANGEENDNKKNEAELGSLKREEAAASEEKENQAPATGNDGFEIPENENVVLMTPKKTPNLAHKPSSMRNTGTLLLRTEKVKAKMNSERKPPSTWLKPDTPAFVPSARKAPRPDKEDRQAAPFSPRAREFSPGRPAAAPKPADDYDNRPYWERAQSQRQGGYDRPPNSSGQDPYYDRANYDRGYDSKPRNDRQRGAYDDRRGGYDQRGGDQRYDDYHRNRGSGGDHYGRGPNGHDRRRPHPQKDGAYNDRSSNDGYYGRRGPQEGYGAATTSVPGSREDREPPYDSRQAGWPDNQSRGYDRPPHDYHSGRNGDNYGRPQGGYNRDSYPPRQPNPPPLRNGDAWERSNNAPPRNRDSGYNSGNYADQPRPKKKPTERMGGMNVGLPSKAKKDVKKNSYINMMMDL